jgi:hypothetical protein
MRECVEEWGRRYRGFRSARQRTLRPQSAHSPVAARRPPPRGERLRNPGQLHRSPAPVAAMIGYDQRGPSKRSRAPRRAGQRYKSSGGWRFECMDRALQVDNVQLAGLIFAERRDPQPSVEQHTSVCPELRMEGETQ